MDKKLLFRGKCINGSRKGKLVEGNGVVQYANHTYIYKTHIVTRPDVFSILPQTLEPYTGLDTDVKSTKIFKGDIVLFDDGDVCFIGKVDKECGAWGIVADYIPLDYSEACHNDNFISFWEIMCNAENPDLILDDVVPYVEVIGNIHDNPELLEAAK